jgi:chaperonin GroES
MTDKIKRDCQIRPLRDLVIVRRDPEDDRTRGGIILPDDSKTEKCFGTVLAAGPGMVLDDGTRLAMDIKVGDRVFFSAYAGSRIDPDDVTLIMLIASREVLGVVEGGCDG